MHTPVLGIIAEFNPLHNGHCYFIDQARKLGDFSAIICAMSGNFVQRGEAAICNKWVRARMALEAGVDLVVELPFSSAVRSAFYFARGGIELLSRTGVVTHLAFGSELGRLSTLQTIARLLAYEPSAYKIQLKDYLAQGLSFPVARAKAVHTILGAEIDALDSILLQPNNILALEYLRALCLAPASLLPITIPRRGSGYNSSEMSSYASATAIRQYLRSHPADGRLADAMPASAFDLLRQEIEAGRAPNYVDGLESAILSILRTTPKERLSRIYEISEGLENRIQEAANLSGSMTELTRSIKSKRYSSTRINRLLLYILLNIESRQMLGFDQVGPQYLHILGFSTKGRKILQEIKNKSSLRLLNRGTEVKAASRDIDDPRARGMLQLDVQATDIYTLLYPCSTARVGSQDFTTSPIILGDHS